MQIIKVNEIYPRARFAALKMKGKLYSEDE